MRRAGGEGRGRRAEARVGQDLLGGVVEDLRRSGRAVGQLGRGDLSREWTRVGRPPGLQANGLRSPVLPPPSFDASRARTKPLKAGLIFVFYFSLCLGTRHRAGLGQDLFGVLFEKARKLLVLW